MKTKKIHIRGRGRAVLFAAAVSIPGSAAIAGTTGSATTISTAGSTALKNWFVKSTTTFTDVTPGTQVEIGGVEYPSSLSEWAPQYGGTGTALAFQLAPKSYNGGQEVTSAEAPGTLADQASAVRFEYHESGSVEGILEMANDQIGPVGYVTQNVDRNPSTGIGNAVWVNYTAVGGSTTAIPFSPVTGADTSNTAANDYHLGNFYSGTNTFTSAASMGGAQPQFNLAGGNLNGGQNAVQLAVSDAIPVQVFAQPSTGTDSNAATPWARTPADANYGTGNPLLSTGLVGTANSRQVYQSTAALNMSATAINPRTGAAFGTGPWNSGGLNNLTTQTVAITATLFVANPGTGLTQVNQTDAQWLETTGRLQNGAVFNMTTRDVNSGTRNVSALETGIDPTWAVGKNDNGNGTFDGMDLYLLATGASLASNTAGYQPVETHTATGTVFTTGHLNASAATFSTAVDGGALYKNTALDYLQANATPRQKIDAAAVLELPVGVTAVPTGATAVGTDAVSGQVQYTFDPAGTNAFNKTDVNRDGVVDFNDAVLIDNNNGQDYTSLANSLTATEQAPLTGTSVPANLVLISQTDTGTKIGANDLIVADSALTGVGATNWYGYALNKTGPGTITFGRTGGTVTVFSTAAALNISAGAVQIGAAMDPFTGSNATSNTDTTKSIGVTANGGTLEYLPGSSGINLQRIGALNVSTGGLVQLDPASVHTARTALEVGSLTLSGGKVDLGNGDLIVQGGNLAAITAAVASGYNYAGGGNFAGATGITSSSAAGDSSHLTALGVVQNNQGGSTLFNAASLFDGTAPNPGDVLVKYTYLGDANLDGKIDGSDYTRIDAGYASAGASTGWYNGDFNYDGVVDGSDYALIDNAFNNQGAQLSTPTALVAAVTDQVAPPADVAGQAVPEPTSLGLLTGGTIAMISRRRRA